MNWYLRNFMFIYSRFMHYFLLSIGLILHSFNFNNLIIFT